MCCFCLSRKTNKACTMAIGAAFAVTGIIIAVLGFNLNSNYGWVRDLFPTQE